ncbi:hypothetical protein PRIPAC_70576 [Pristionchus pacificus]|uniref:Uncharacterized protein n=1 Tax=Pristionchus pacificus TaxID=54126 RepID=A0A2A6C5G0_PRIPA|nr:hypothetical protein PRIPAC_70576 [Pristionchus pacificus]|eukprot:PDM73283.1 hypothetical protein PRIPAC_40639 [Pristionchus pacificus]
MASTRTFLTGCMLAVIVAVLVNYADACAASNPSNSNGERVIVVAVTKDAYTTAEAAGPLVETFLTNLKKYAAKNGHSLFTAPISKTPENVNTKVAVRFEIMGAFDKCLRILEFFQKAASTTALAMESGVESASVQCGTFDTVDIPKAS